MRELAFKTGGRKLFNEDLSDLQEQIRAAESLFLGEEPFVISGMIFTGSTGAYNISEGYVWLGNKIRKVDEITSFDEISQTTHLLSNNISEETEYDDNIDRQSTISYEYELKNNLDTSGIPSSELLRIDDIPNIRRYFENVLGDKYVLKDSGQAQVIANNLSLTGATIVSDADITTTSDINAVNMALSGDLVAFSGDIYTVQGDISSVQGSIMANEFRGINSATPSIDSNGIIGDNKVVTDSIANGNVTSDKIGNGSVIADKIGTGAVTSGKLGSESVITDKILDGNVTYSKLSTDTQNSFSQVSYLGGGSFTKLKTHIQEIGVWNMLDDEDKEVQMLGTFVNSNEIVSLSAVIYDDNLIQKIYPFGQTSVEPFTGGNAQGIPDGSIETVSGSQGALSVKISRTNGSRFDNNNFNDISGGRNRGYITITYIA